MKHANNLKTSTDKEQKTMSDQQDNTITWMDLAKHTTSTLGIEPEIAGAQVMSWVMFMHDREPDFNRMAIPHSYIDKFIDMAGIIYKARHGKKTDTTIGLTH